MARNYLRPISDAHIHAYVDGQLKRERGQGLHAILGDRPEKNEQVREYKKINEQLSAILAPILNEPIPDSILSVLRSGEKQPEIAVAAHGDAGGKPAKTTKKEKPTMATKDKGVDLAFETDLDTKQEQLQQAGAGLGRGIMSVLLLLLGILGGWNLRNNFQFQEEINAATVNRAINGHNVFAAQPQEFTNRRSLDRLFRRWLKRSVKIPQDKNLSLKGGRILTVDSNGVAGFLVYKAKKSDKLMSLYIDLSQNNIDVARPFCERIEPVTACYWQRDSLNFVLVSDQKADDLRELSKTFILQLLPETQ